MKERFNKNSYVKEVCYRVMEELLKNWLNSDKPVSVDELCEFLVKIRSESIIDLFNIDS